MKDWTRRRVQTTPSHSNSTSRKISLKHSRSQSRQLEPTQHSSTCRTAQKSSHKKTISSMTQASRSTQFTIHPYLNISYEDIRCPPMKQPTFLQNLFCGEKKKIQQQGCQCENKCIWINYWISLSCYIPSIYKVYTLQKKTDIQIRKDIQRTQPDYKQFTKIHYQQALYQSLVNYAKIDPQINYIQGMNIICSVFVYHGSSIQQCVQLFKYLMITCQFRNLYRNNFKLAYQIADTIQQNLKYKCYTLYTHMIEYCEIKLSQFVLGWLIPLLGNIIPLNKMHLVINTFMQKSWIGLIKIIITMLLYLQKQILNIKDQSQLMHMLSTQKLRNRNINWEEIIKSSHNLKNVSFVER